MKLRSRKEFRRRRHLRVRRKVRGTAERPRMAVSVSNRGICVQFIDDDRQATVAAAALRGKKNVEGARQLGREAAAAAIASGVGIVVVDRGGHKYHGRVQAVVEAAVEGGLRVSEKPAEGAASAGGPPPEEAGKSAARSKEAK